MCSMNKNLRDQIKEKADNCCSVCGQWCGSTGSPHHVVKLSEEHLLINCEMNIWWLCSRCHAKTETKPGYNKELQITLQEYYRERFKGTKFYTANSIQKIVNIPLVSLYKAMEKDILKNHFGKCHGNDVVRFLMGGKEVSIYERR